MNPTLRRVVVYNEAPGLDTKPVERELDRLGVAVEWRPPLPQPGSGEAWTAWLAWHLAWSKVRRPDRPIPLELEPAPLEVDREAAALRGEGNVPGPMYDGRRLMESWHGPLPAEHASPGGDAVLVLTDRLIGTFEGARYHVRFLVAGHPSIISVPGFVDGPARRREYYLAKQIKGIDPNEAVDDPHVGARDERLSTCVVSAMLQVVAYRETGHAFCDDDSCRLFNPHWQAELVESMATHGLCDAHAGWLDEVPAADGYADTTPA